ncbi:MAG: aspartyl-tRNA amidotransferase subunit B [Candidatus Tectimicrobiota bacterium]|nr:MAG: aspartyl-tRNA amidotransferase subunit B [Candidatus Tectomicrobia bacterium]
MSLRERLQSETMQAMKRGERERVSTLRLLSAALKNREIALGRPLAEAEELEVVQAAVKQRRETINLARQHGREEIAQKEERELAILEAYLPAPLSEEELRQHIEAAIRDVGASSPQDVGRVMRVLMPALRGRVAGSELNRLVRERLTRGSS